MGQPVEKKMTKYDVQVGILDEKKDISLSEDLSLMIIYR